MDIQELYLQEMVDKMNETQQEMRSKEMFTLGNLIDELSKYPSDWGVYIRPFNLVPVCFRSYRGYYCDLTLTYTTREEAIKDKSETTVGELLAMANEANGKEFYGYHGGEFKMDRNTPVWVSDDDYSTGVAIAKVEKCYDGLIEIHCYQRED